MRNEASSSDAAVWTVSWVSRRACSVCKTIHKRKSMKSVIQSIGAGLVGLCVVTSINAQTASSPAAPATSKSAVAGGTSAGRTDVYHVHLVHAVPGKAAEL